jgi:hypothetical protein
MKSLGLQKSETAMYGVIITFALATLLADPFVPLGIAVWVIYLLPMAFTFFVWPSSPYNRCGNDGIHNHRISVQYCRTGAPNCFA